MKKIWIGVIIVGLGISGFIGGVYYTKIGNSNTQQSAISNIQLKASVKNNSSNENSTINTYDTFKN